MHGKYAKINSRDEITLASLHKRRWRMDIVGFKVTQRLLVRNQNNSGKNILTIYSPQEWSATTNNKQVDA